MYFWVFFGIVLACYFLFRFVDSPSSSLGGGIMPSALVPFEKKWPAISDDEFLDRCSPGTRRETALKVRRIVSEQLGIPYDHIYPEQNFVDDLGCG